MLIISYCLNLKWELEVKTVKSSLENLFIYLVLFSPMIYTWLVLTHVIHGWYGWAYIVVFIVLSLASFFLIERKEEERVFRIAYSGSLIANVFVYAFLKWSFNLIGPGSESTSIILGIWFILLALCGVIMNIGKNNEEYVAIGSLGSFL
ncbi:MAG: hypothetical protein NTY12_04625 [Candidatus Falkowbacteria bacterium]|nr:hypothetical protein [Candidatus Falkowbacteria bacterium]